jgi:hypothetical protein
MNLKQLQTFVLVADLGSLSRAATTLDMAPSLVSRQVALLEAEWGDRLFERTGRGMAPSDFGRRMLGEAKRVLDQVQRLESVAHESAGALTGTVHVGVLPSMSRPLLPLMALGEELKAGTLGASRVVGPEIPRTIALGLSTHRPLSRAARFVATRLRQLASEVVKG